MPFCPNPDCPHRKRHGEPAEFRKEISVCSDCGSQLSETRPAFEPAQKTEGQFLKTKADITLIQVAVVVLRISGIGWLFDALVLLTSLPGDIMGVLALKPGYLASQRELALVMLLVKECLYLAIGIAFLFFARPLAKLVTKDET